VEIVVTGRHMQVSDRFRDHLDEKLAKIPQLAPRVQRVDVIVSHEPNKRQAKACERVEITCHVKGPIVRAEACLDDKYAALDLALDKLMERLRRAQDRKRVHRGRHAPESVAAATARIRESGEEVGELSSEDHVHDELDGDGDRFGAQGDSPVEIREKIHATVPMPLDQAVREMELVGHDFYLYHDEDTGQPSVVYRRRGWSYGVIHLDVTDDEGAEQKVS
jgi:ribosomal subunit interface protein